MSRLAEGALQTFTASMSAALAWVGLSYALHGHISWWYFVAIFVWGFALMVQGANAVWNPKAGKR